MFFSYIDIQLYCFLKFTTEFIVENLVDFLLFLKRFEPNKLDDFVTNSNYLLVLINIFMGNHSRLVSK